MTFNPLPIGNLFIVGVGGIGCALGHALWQAGLRPIFVDANEAKVRWGRRHGVGLVGGPLMPADVQHFADWSPPREALVLLCTKCYDNAAVLARLPQSVTLVPIQNGFDPVLEERSFALEGIASFVSECVAGQTQAHYTRHGSLHLGGRRAAGLPLARQLGELLRHSARFRVRVVPDILPFKHTKLMYNAAISPLAAAAGIDNGQLLAVPSTRRLFFELLQENYQILMGASVPLGTIGPFAPRTVSKILNCRRLANALAWAFYPSLRRTYCSMAGDIRTGRTEADYYNGYLIRLAGDRPCPRNRQVYALLKQVEQQGLRPHIKLLDVLP